MSSPSDSSQAPSPRLVVRIVCVVLIAAAITSCDQGTKYLAEGYLTENGPVDVAGGILRLTFTMNSGGFLGLGSSLDPRVRWWIFTGGVTLMLLLLFGSAITSSWVGMQILGLSLVLGGGFGNLLDRLFLAGSVRDFAVLSLGPLRTGVFNLADTAVLVGMAMVLLGSRSGRSEDESDNEENPPSESETSVQE